ncbi:unnamed protein product [Ambrosiozyma monospora]|uniref:Unnamed protein product n=1 Tax=Ambrosiozyma monospora TaxID=43982 RepID=A0ACB5SUX4_AMBMO|nr:unnamed protein product [Ambrosiozyma monospora]
MSSASSAATSRQSSISNQDNLIDVMEKEQEGIVLKLMKEIQALKEENNSLKQQINRMATSSSSSSLNSMSSSSTTLTKAPSNTSSTTGGAGGGLSRSGSQRRNTATNIRRFPATTTATTNSNCIVLDSYDCNEYRTKKNRRRSTPAGSLNFNYGNYTIKPPEHHGRVSVTESHFN